MEQAALHAQPLPLRQPALTEEDVAALSVLPINVGQACRHAQHPDVCASAEPSATHMDMCNVCSAAWRRCSELLLLLPPAAARRSPSLPLGD